MGKYKKTLIFISLSMPISMQLLNMEKLITTLFFKKSYIVKARIMHEANTIYWLRYSDTLSAENYIYPAECKYEFYNICTVHRYVSCAMIYLMHVTLYVM